MSAGIILGKIQELEEKQRALKTGLEALPLVCIVANHGVSNPIEYRKGTSYEELYRSEKTMIENTGRELESMIGRYVTIMEQRLREIATKIKNLELRYEQEKEEAKKA